MTVSLLTLSVREAGAQTPIYYNRYTQATGLSAQLFRLGINSDTPIAIGLIEGAIPAVSRNGRFLAVTSGDPQRPSQVSKDLFVLDLATGVVRQVIDNVDFFDFDTGQSSSKTPFYKAFSPDGSLIAISSGTLVTGGVMGGAATIRGLEIFRLTDGAWVATVHDAGFSDQLSTALDGVDWSPTTGELITPLRTTVVLQGGGGQVGTVTALWGMPPTGNAHVLGLSRQITFPGSSLIVTPTTIEIQWENDFLPAFSPNGVGIAYFRSLERTVAPTTGGTFRTPCQVSLRIVDRNGNNDRAIFTFQQGVYPNSVSWAPDGNSLIVSVGPQQSVNGGPILRADPFASQLFFVSTAGGALQSVGVSGSTHAVWSMNNPPVLVPRLLLERAPGSSPGLVLRTIGADPLAILRLQSSGDLGNWQTIQTVTGAEANQGLALPQPADVVQQFFRVLPP